MKDWLLDFVISMANTGKFTALITLHVGEAMVEGELASIEEYKIHLRKALGVEGERLTDLVKTLGAKVAMEVAGWADAAESEEASRPGMFPSDPMIYLKNAKIQTTTGEHDIVFWRGPVSEITWFSLSEKPRVPLGHNVYGKPVYEE